MFRLIVVFLLLVLVTGCSIPTTQSARSVLEEDATVVVRQEIAVPAGARDVWLQRGELHDRHWSFWEPYCRLRVGGDPDQPRTITPERFHIEWVRPQHSVGERERIRLAARVGAVRLHTADTDAADADPEFIQPELVMGLRSENQARVERLTCGVRRSTITLQEPPTIAMIEEAVGDYIDIETGQ